MDNNNQFIVLLLLRCYLVIFEELFKKKSDFIINYEGFYLTIYETIELPHYYPTSAITHGLVVTLVPQ
jgi:hypothetical protein